MTSKDISKLITAFKQLVDDDIVGITSSDARNLMTQWLHDIGESKQAERFSHQVWKYQNSPAFEKKYRDYNG